MELKKPDVLDRVIEFISFRFDQEVDRWQVIAALCVALLVLIYSVYGMYRAWSARSVRVIAATVNEKNAGSVGASGKKGNTQNRQWAFVYLCGSVQKPGVYRVGAGTRLNAAVALAGGLTADGDETAVNMARLVIDGERIYIPKVGERVSAIGAGIGVGGSSSGASGSYNGNGSVDNSSSGLGSGTGDSGRSDDGSSAFKDGSGRINVNAANTAALDTIPGIGPTLAARIIDYRQKRNGFTDINQLSEVTGIGSKTLAKIKPYIYVE
jgi:competence protein ComEA